MMAFDKLGVGDYALSGLAGAGEWVTTSLLKLLSPREVEGMVVHSASYSIMGAPVAIAGNLVDEDTDIREYLAGSPPVQLYEGTIGAWRSSAGLGRGRLVGRWTAQAVAIYAASRMLPVGKGAAAEASVAKTVGQDAKSALQGAQLNRHLSQLEKYGSAGSKMLQNGRIRYYGDVAPARTPGEMVGRRLVREWDPWSNAIRTWHETLDGAGTVRQVRPVTDGPKVHYRFDANGNYIGSW